MGNQLSEFRKKLPALAQVFPPKSTFSVDQIPDLTGRVVIVTGMYSHVFHLGATRVGRDETAC